MQNLALATVDSTEVATSAPPPPSEAQRQWARCRPWLERSLALGPGLESIEDIERAIEDGRLIFWAGEDSALLTRIDTLPLGTILVVTLAGGDSDPAEQVAKWLPEMQRFAKIADCSFIEVVCQDAGVPILEEVGFRVGYHTMRMATEAQGKWPTDKSTGVTITNAQTEGPPERGFGEGAYGKGAYGKGAIPGKRASINCETSK